MDNAEIDRQIALLKAQQGNLTGMLTSVGAQFPPQAQASTTNRIIQIAGEIAALEAQKT